MGRALVYDPYLPTLGGGERYALALAQVLARHMDTLVGGPDPDPARLKAMGMSAFPVVRMDDGAFTRESARMELVVVLANRLPPPSLARRSFAVVQFPFPGSMLRHPRRFLRRGSLLGRYELITYSDYVRSWVWRRWHRDAAVIHPPVPAPAFAREAAHAPDAVPIILSVGRFFGSGHSKRQDVLIAAFRELLNRHEGPRPHLVLAGGRTPGSAGTRYLSRIEELARGLPVTLAVDVNQDDLQQLYRGATLFWHAAGYGRQTRHPERAEHFGISLVEAMAHGAVPLAFDDGGAREILTERSGITWRTIDELVTRSSELLTDERARCAMASAARTESERFSPAHFEQRATEVLLAQLPSG